MTEDECGKLIAKRIRAYANALVIDYYGDEFLERMKSQFLGLADFVEVTPECEYGECTSTENLIREEVGDQVVTVCEPCSNRIEDQTGFCSVDCRMGHGCDDTC